MTLVELRAVNTIRPGDLGYPGRLGDVSDPPSLLYVLGTLVSSDRSIAIVGSRAASKRGTACARRIACELVGLDSVVVSGGALGIDTAAHAGALDGDGSTVAVLGTGLDVAYPARNARLFDTIRRRGGALVTPYKEGAQPLPHHFLRRNRIIAGLSDAVVVVEASARSGSLHTARAARAYGRTVVAVPGSPGTEWLISTGAAVAESAEDVLAALGGRPRRPDIVLPEAGSERNLVLLALGGRVGRNPSELSNDTGVNPRRVNQHLLGLELSGLAVSLPGCTGYVQSPLAHELLAQTTNHT